MYYKATVNEISIVTRIAKKVQSRIKTPKLATICGNLIYIKCAPCRVWGKGEHGRDGEENCFNKWSKTDGYPNGKKVNIYPYLLNTDARKVRMNSSIQRIESDLKPSRNAPDI